MAQTPPKLTRRWFVARALMAGAAAAASGPLKALASTPVPAPSDTASGWRLLSKTEREQRMRLVQGDTLISVNARAYLQAHWPSSESAQVQLLRSLPRLDEVLPSFSHKLIPDPQPRLQVSVSGTQRCGESTLYRLSVADGARISNLQVSLPNRLAAGYEQLSLEQVLDAVSRLPGRSVRQFQRLNFMPSASPEDAAQLARGGSPSVLEVIDGTDGDDPKLRTLKIWASPVQGRTAIDIAKALIHESSHPSAQGHFNASRGPLALLQNTPAWDVWRTAVRADGVFLSRFARDTFPQHASEDYAETFALFLALEGTPELEEIRRMIPNRAALVDDLLPKLMAQIRELSTFSEA